MKQEIETKNIDICISTTLATAYRGAITSPVANDFCMSDSGDLRSRDDPVDAR